MKIKNFFFGAFFILISTGIYGQIDQVSKCGLNDEAHLNSFEVMYFNQVFDSKRKDFSFENKKIGYFTGSSGTTKSSKLEYFAALKTGNNGDRDLHTWQAKGTQLLVLDHQEKELSGGYDAILVSWSKFSKEGKSRMKLVKDLKGTLPNM
ncbi:MAG: hypothetical protein MRY83_20085 [Flavobacteriales bacterium]|nr:hypothetical protein [Flavobacteriales bacterium]